MIDLKSTRRRVREQDWKLSNEKVAHAAALAQETQRLADYFEQNVVSNYEALIDRHRLFQLDCDLWVCDVSFQIAVDVLITNISQLKCNAYYQYLTIASANYVITTTSQHAHPTASRWRPTFRSMARTQRSGSCSIGSSKLSP